MNCARGAIDKEKKLRKVKTTRKEGKGLRRKEESRKERKDWEKAGVARGQCCSRKAKEKIVKGKQEGNKGRRKERQSCLKHDRNGVEGSFRFVTHM